MIEHTVPTTHQFIKHTRQTMEPGDVIQSWCSFHQEVTSHLWTGHRLICLVCHPELKPEESE